MGQHVVNLAAREPATGASEVVRRRAAEVLASGGPLGYTEALGMPALREAIAAHYEQWYGLTPDPRSVAVTTGSSGGCCFRGTSSGRSTHWPATTAS